MFLLDISKIYVRLHQDPRDYKTLKHNNKIIKDNTSLQGKSCLESQLENLELDLGVRKYAAISTILEPYLLFLNRQLKYYVGTIINSKYSSEFVNCQLNPDKTH